MKRVILSVSRVAAAGAVVILAASAGQRTEAQTPLGTAFTYQGRLKSGGSPASGSYDLQFTLYAVPAGGTIVSGPICADNVNVADGLFTVPLDFGGVFDGNERWLQIGVRADSTAGNCGTGAYTPLTTRQLLTATPYAARALSAPNGHALDAADGSPTNALFVDDFGSVGIGTTAPVSRLTLQTASDAFGLVHTDGAVEVGSYVDASGGWYGTASNHPLHFFTNNSFQQMTLTTAGNVGIGTTTPANRLSVGGDADFSGYVGIGTTAPVSRLTVQSGSFDFGLVHTDGAVSVGSYVDTSGGWYGTVSNHPLHFFTNNSFQQMTLTTAGNVGIGTTTPTFPLSLGTALGNKIALYDAFGTTFGFGIQPSLLQIFSAFSVADIAFGYGDSNAFTETMRIKGNGNVGIGTTSPAEKLSVAGNARVDGTLFASTVSSNSPLALQTGGTTRVFVDDTTGNVGIGITPSTRLHVYDAQGSFDTPAPALARIHNNNDSNCSLSLTTQFRTWRVGQNRPPDNMLAGSDAFFIYDGGAGATRMAITPSGNVGIGTTSPAQKLHVVGNICANGTIGACSDGRFKKNVMGLTGALDRVAQLRGVSFEWKREEFADHQFAEGRQVGFIAQEVREVAPEVVQEGSDGYLSIDYGRLTPVLVQALRELRAEKEGQLAERDRRIEKLAAQNAALESRLAALERASNEPRTGQEK